MTRAVFLLLFVSLHIKSSCSLLNTYNALTLQQKLALLFVVDAEDLTASNLVPGVLVVDKNDQYKPGLAYTQPLVLLNASQGIDDELEVSFPSSTVLKACSKPDDVVKLYHQYLAINTKIKGLFTDFFPLNQHLFYDDELSAIQKHYVVLNSESNSKLIPDVIAVLPLPKYFMNRKPRLGVSHHDISPVFKQTIDKPAYLKSIESDLGFSLEDIISKPYLFKTDNLQEDVAFLAHAIESQMFNYQLLEERIKWILTKQLECRVVLNVSAFQGKQHTALRRLTYENSLSLVRNQDQSVPLNHLSNKKIIVFDARTDNESINSLIDLVSFHYSSAQWKDSFDIEQLAYALDEQLCCIVLVDSKESIPKTALTSWKIKSKYPNAQIHLILNSDNLDEGIIENDYSCFSSAIVGYDSNDFSWFSSIQGLFGGMALSGKNLYVLHGLTVDNTSILTEKCRLKIGCPEEVGMSTDSLNSIGDVMNVAIQNRATPGGQVIVARNGVVVYRKSFGKKTYNGGETVGLKDMYDIASLTKIMSTTPIIMHLAEKGSINLNNHLSQYLPETDTTNKAKLRIKDLLLHQAGLQPMVPTFYSYIDRKGLSQDVFSRRYSSSYPYKIDDRLYLNKKVTLLKEVFSTTSDSIFSVCVANNLFMNYQFADSIYQSILMSKVDVSKTYRYSDMGFVLLQHLIEKIKKQSIDIVADSLIYKPLGLDRICYLPLKRFNEATLVPTENDTYFRKQLIRGYVHDPGAAMMGGVAGNAGLFACGDDVCKMMQMYLDNGEYGNIQLFKPETVQMFTKQYNLESRRGLGFDKPEMNPDKTSPACGKASSSSFGHTGFTGALAWADPETKLVFIFLSNRISPDAFNKKLINSNVRTIAMEKAYDAIFTPVIKATK